MGAFATALLQGIGRTGSDVAEGRLAEQKRQLEMIKSKIGLDEIQQRMSLQQQAAQRQTPAGTKAYLKGVLGRDPTNDELQRYLGVQPTVPKAKYVDLKQDTKGKWWGLNNETQKMEQLPGQEEFEAARKAGNPKADFQRLFSKALSGVDPKLAKATDLMTNPAKVNSIIQGSSALTEDEKRDAMSYLATNSTPASQAAARAQGYQILAGPRWAALDPKVQARIAAARSMAAGTYGAQLTSFNAFLGHAKDMLDYFGQLENLDMRFLNIPINRLRESTNSPEIIGVIAKMQPVQKEFQTLLLNNRALYETDREDAQKILDENMTLGQVHEAINSFTNTVAIRLGAMNSTIKRVTGADIPEIVEPDNGSFMWEMGAKIPDYTGNTTFESMFPAPNAPPAKKGGEKATPGMPPKGAKIIKWSDVK